MTARVSAAAPYAPLATALIGLLAAKAMTGGFGNLGGLFGGGQPAPQAQPRAAMARPRRNRRAVVACSVGSAGLLHQFQQNGMGNVAQSWVGPGPNQPANPTQVTQALGPEIIQQLVQKTGMSEQQILQQLSQELPDAGRQTDPAGTPSDPPGGFVVSERRKPAQPGLSSRVLRRKWVV